MPITRISGSTGKVTFPIKTTLGGQDALVKSFTIDIDRPAIDMDTFDDTSVYGVVRGGICSAVANVQCIIDGGTDIGLGVAAQTANHASITHGGVAELTRYGGWGAHNLMGAGALNSLASFKLGYDTAFVPAGATAISAFSFAGIYTVMNYDMTKFGEALLNLTVISDGTVSAGALTV